jgi:hypothetical protein
LADRRSERNGTEKAAKWSPDTPKTVYFVPSDTSLNAFHGFDAGQPI